MWQNKHRKLLQFLSTIRSTRGAYTLVEVMIVIAVLGVLFTASMTSLNSSRDTQDYNNNFDQLLSMLNNARSMAISAKGQTDYVDADGDGDKTDLVTPANYGVRFEQNSPSKIILFADNNTNSSSDADAKKKVYDFNSSNCNTPENGCDFILKEYTFDKKYELKVYKGDVNGQLHQVSSTITAIDGFPSIFYSPLYADIAVEGANIGLDDLDFPFLIIRFQESSGPKRCRQIKIHFLAGNPEVSACTVDQP